MKGQTHGGKGSSPRPTNKRRFDENYEAIFNKKATENQVELDEGIHTPEADGRSGESKFREHVEGAGVQGQADQEQAIKQKPIACPYPCGWNTLYSIIVQKGAYLARSTMVEDAIFTSHQRNEMVRIIDYAKTLCEWGKNTHNKQKAIAQEPVAWRVYYESNQQYTIFQQFPDGLKHLDIQPLYTNPPKQEQEQAVAWIYEKPLADGFSERTLSFGYESEFDGVITPLYAHLPKREPLSDSVIERIIFDWDDAEEMDLVEFARAIEKTHGIGKENE